MTETPETDAAYKNHPWDMHDNIPLEFARKLERERDKYWDQSDYFLEQLGHTQIRMYDAERKLEKITEALEYILGIGLTQKTKAKAEKALNNSKQ